MARTWAEIKADRIKASNATKIKTGRTAQQILAERGKVYAPAASTSKLNLQEQKIEAQQVKSALPPVPYQKPVQYTSPVTKTIPFVYTPTPSISQTRQQTALKTVEMPQTDETYRNMTIPDFSGAQAEANQYVADNQQRLTNYNPKTLPWYRKVGNTLSAVNDTVKSFAYGLAGKAGGNAISRISENILFGKNKQAGYKEPQTAEEADAASYRTWMDKDYNWRPDSSDNISRNVGEVAGKVISMVGIGKIAGAASGMLKVAPWLQRILSTTITGATSGAIDAYGEGKSPLEMAKEAGRMALFMGVGSVASGLTGGVALKIMNKTGIQNSIAAEIARQGLKGAAFGGAGIAATIPTYSDDEKPSAKDIIMSAFAGALFEAIPGAIAAIRVAKANRGVIDYMMTNFEKDMKSDYIRAKKATTLKETANIYEGMISKVEAGQSALSQNRYLGQSAKVKDAQSMLATLKEFLQNQKAIYTQKVSNIKLLTSPATDVAMTQMGRFPIEPTGQPNPPVNIQQPIQQEPAQAAANVPNSSNVISPTKPTSGNKGNFEPPAANIPNLTYGRSGKKAYEKWGRNEWVNANLDNPDDPYTQKWTQFFNKWYNAGKEGINQYKVIEDENDAEFPNFLKTAIYSSGKNDAPVKQSEAVPAVKEPITRPVITPEIKPEVIETKTEFEQPEKKPFKEESETEFESRPINVLTPQGMIKTDAKTYKGVAVHLQVNSKDKKRYVVTHIASGKALNDFPNEQLATDVAKALADNIDMTVSEVGLVLKKSEIQSIISTAVINNAKASEQPATQKPVITENIGRGVQHYIDIVHERLLNNQSVINSVKNSDQSNTKIEITVQIMKELAAMMAQSAKDGGAALVALDKAQSWFNDNLNSEVENIYNTLKNKQDKSSKADIAYHAGDLGKAETYGRFFGSRRGTGHFGTGTYFVANKDSLMTGSYKDRPLHEANLSAYKLYKPISEKEAGRLHDVLKFINNDYEATLINRIPPAEMRELEYEEDSEIIRILRKYGKFNEDVFTENAKETADEYINNKRDTADGHNALKYFVKNVQSEADRIERALRNKEDFDKDAPTLFKKPLNTLYDLVEQAYEDIKTDTKGMQSYEIGIDKGRGLDSASTRFMKALGYEGVDVRHLPNYDNTTYGTVVYDYKAPESMEDIVKNEDIEISTAEVKSEIETSVAEGDKPHDIIAKEINKYLENGTAFSSDRLFEIANKAYGGTMAEGKYSIKDAYDSMELAVNKFLLNKLLLTNPKKYNSSNIDVVNDGIVKFQDMLKNIPTQTKRNTEMDRYQQFSTPPNIAYLAAWAANINKSDTVLEPSAGIGGLALFPKAWGAKVIVNELSKRRLEILNSMGFDKYFNYDAEQIDNILPENIKPTVVIMNPPFSSAAERMGDKNATANAKRHIEQALARLEPNGRLVAIVGHGMADDAPSFQNWWNVLKSKHNVRANIGINGSNYKKYGTTFGIQIVVIDKTGANEKPTITGNYDDLMDVPKVLEGIRNERLIERTKATGEVQQNEVVTGGIRTGIETGSHTPIYSAGDGRSPENVQGHEGERQGTTDQGSNGPDRVVVSGEAVQVTNGTVRGETPAVMGDGQISQNGETIQPVNTDGQQFGVRADVRAEPEQSGIELETPDEVKTIIENDNDVYSNYVPRKLKITGAHEHITALVESAAMSAVDPPDITYTPNLPQKVITNGELSIAQLESIVYAGQAHEQILVDGKRRGFFIGDGTGVGKGREICGIILDNFRQGRKKAVWITNDPKLLYDAIRDWTDLGQNKADIKDISKYKANIKIEDNTGIIFSSYMTLKSGSQLDPEATRVKQIVDWFGKDYDGVIVFDEAHNMSNARDAGNGLNRTKASKKALAGIELQNLLPNARIVYSSATGATNVEHLAYLTRLGLWGEGTAFHDVDDFLSQISSGGLASMELVARDMKALGSYISRNLSFKGVEYDTITHDLTPIQEQIYNSMCLAWQKVFVNIENSLNITGGHNDGRAKGRAWSQFYSAMLRFYNQIITSMSMPTVVADIRSELAKGNSAVIQLVNTNQAATDRQIAAAEDTGLELDDIDLTPADTLVQYLMISFPIYQYEEYIDDSGNKKTRLVMADGKPVINREAVRNRDALIAEIKDMKVPDGPMEILFNEFGVENVAEVTGRNRRVVPKKDANGQIKKVLENRTPTMALADTQAFQDGKKKILVFSDAGGTGKSYHADRKAKNQSKRIHYLLQGGWSAFKATQGFGRSHRSGQVVPPLFRLVTTNIKGQKRFTSTIAKRLDQLGALTKGQRQAGSGMFSQKDNLESQLAKDALHIFYQHLDMKIIKKLGLKDKLTDAYGNYKDDPSITYNITMFLNRILALELEEQNQVFDDFYNLYERVFDKAVADGNVEMGLENYRAEKIILKEDQTIRKDNNTGAETKYLQLTAYKKPIILRYEAVTDYKTEFKGLYRINDNGEVKAVYKSANKTLNSGEVVASYNLLSPMLGHRSEYIQTTMDEKTTKIPKKEWENAWNEQIKKLPKYNEETLHMFTGTLLPIWNKLPTENTRVVRIITDDGKQFLGRIIPESQIDAVLRQFNIGRIKEVYTPEGLYKRIMENDEVVQLQNDKIKLERRKVSGENRIEITGINLWFYNRMDGVINERIAYQNRYFIPVGEKAIPIIARIIKDNPVVSVNKKTVTSEEDAFSSTTTGPKMGPASGANVSGEAKRASEIYKDFADKLGFAVKKGGTGYGALGNFNNRTYIMRIRKANDIPVLSHETGHYLDALYKISTSRAYLFNELESLGKATSKPSYSKERVRREGIAEFVRLYLTDENEAQKQAPETYKYFESKVPAPVISVLKGLRKDIWDLTNLDPVERVKRSIHFYNDKEARATIDFKGFLRSVYTDFFNETYPVEWGAGELGGKSFGEHIKYKLAAMRGFEGMALYDLNPKGHKGFYQTDLGGERVGPSYSELVAPIHKSEEMRKDFMAYLLARRSRDYFKRGLELPDTQETYDENVRILNIKYPEFAKVFDNLLEYRKNLTHLMVESGIYSEESYNKMVEANPNYVSLKRVKEAFDLVAGATKKLSGAKRLIKGLKGGGEDILDPEVSDINNTFIYRSAAMRNAILVELADMADKVEGKGYIMSKAARKLKPVEFNLEKVKKALEDIGIDTTGLDLDTMTRIFQPNYLAGPNQVVVYRDGKPVLYDIHPDVYGAVAGLPALEMGKGVATLMAIAQITKGGILFTPKYLAYNFARDTGQGLMNSTVGLNPVDIVTGLFSAINKDEWYRLAMRKGGTTNYFSANDRKFAKEAINEIMSGKNKAKVFENNVRHPITRLQDIMQNFELAGQIGNLKRELKKLGNSDAAIEKAIYNMRDLKIDFRRMGRLIKKLQANRIINFLNSQLQGGDKFARVLTGKNTSLRVILLGILYTTIPTMLMLWLNKDNEHYWELPWYRRDFFFNVPIGDPKTTNIFLPIPKSWEHGILFGALPERLISKYVKDDPEAWDEFGQSLKQTFVPDWMPSAFAPILEDMMGVDWRGIPLLSTSDKSVSATNPELQYNEWTSELSKGAANLMKNLPVPAAFKSPKRLEHLITGYTGTLGKVALESIDQWVGVKEGVPVIGGLLKNFVVDADKSPRSVNTYYDYKEILDSQYAAAKKMGNEKLYELSPENIVRTIFVNINTEIQSINDMEDMIKNTEASETVQKALIKELEEKRLKLMQAAVEVYQKALK